MKTLQESHKETCTEKETRAKGKVVKTLQEYHKETCAEENRLDLRGR